MRSWAFASSLRWRSFLDLAFVKALPDQEKAKEVRENLEAKSKKLRQRKDEAKAHERNVRLGKKK